MERPGKGGKNNAGAKPSSQVNNREWCHTAAERVETSRMQPSPQTDDDDVGGNGSKSLIAKVDTILGNDGVKYQTPLTPIAVTEGRRATMDGISMAWFHLSF